MGVYLKSLRLERGCWEVVSGVGRWLVVLGGG